MEVNAPADVVTPAEGGKPRFSLSRFATRLAWVATLVLAAWIVGWFVRALAGRFLYPYELEWMEGGMLGHVARVLQGRPLYAEPSVEFMPFLYGPGFTYVAALFAKLLPLGLPTLRLVSLLSTIAVLAILLSIVFTETRNWLASAMAPVLFVGAFLPSGAWYDIARVDSLALAFALGAVLVIRRAASLRGCLLTGVLAAGAVLTKQSMLAALPTLLLWSFIVARWRGLLAVTLAFALPVLTVAGGLELQSHGWFHYYVWGLPSSHGIRGREFLLRGFWSDELLRVMPVASTLAILFLFGVAMPLRRRVWLFHACLAVCLTLGSYATRLHINSYLNDLMPVYAALAILFGLTLHGLGWPAQKQKGGGTSALCAAALAALQLALLAQNPGTVVPSRSDWEKGRNTVDRIRALPGEVLVVNHPHLAMLAGKRPYTHQMAMVDVFEADRDPRHVRELLRAKWRQAFSEHRFSEVVLDDNWYCLMPELEQSYGRAENLVPASEILHPKTGTPLGPAWTYRPRPH